MVETQYCDNILTAKLSGEIDHHHAPSIRQKIDALTEQLKPQQLHLDFSGVSFMDSSGIGLIMGRSKLIKECGGSLEVKNTQPYIRRVLRLSGIERIVKIT